MNKNRKDRRPYIESRDFYCICGCNEKIEIKSHHKKNGVPRFIRGHHLYSKSEKTINAISNTLKGNIPWNKGKSKYEDPDYTLAKYCKCECGEKIKIAKHHRYYKIPDYIAGHQARNQSEETINKIREKRKYQVLPVKDTSIEIILQEILKANNITFETHKAIVGQPDIFIEPNICIFADGDYWHAIPRKYKDDDLMCYNKQVGRKLTAKEVRQKDNNITNKLIDQGYKVLRFWEYDIKHSIDSCTSILLNH